ncbi:MAG: prolyl aminopeptidase [Parachlamydiaceae bacterium]
MFVFPNLHGTILFPHSSEEVSFDHPLYPISSPREEGFLKVSERHTLFYAVYGNPDGIPVIVLHGGPGAGCNDTLSQSFDLNRWNVVMFDQRGAMRSEPFGCMEENNPNHSISDIEALREHLGIEKWVVFGGSWGSSLALLYGQEHYEHCIGFVLRGVWLVREQDYLHLLYGMGKIFPEAYEPVVSHIPVEERHDLISAYYRRVCDPDPDIHLLAARIFMKFDFICSTHLPNQTYVEKIMQNDKLILSVAKAFFYYAKHGFFLEPNQILSRMQRIDHLPAIIINGRWDAICPPEMAYSLHQNWSNSKLWIVPQGGHTANEPAIAAALSTATDVFADRVSKEVAEESCY